MSLTARALAFGYRDRIVGRDLDLSLAAGEVLCVLGPNGAGKTTLFRTLLGLLPERGGEIRLNGQELHALARRDIARELAYVPQASETPFDFSLLEMVEMGRSAYQGAFAQPSRRDRELALLALERLGIAPLAGRPVGAVSGGERQLALIARAMATEARTIVMDEPTANLDFGNQSRVLHEITRLRADGIAILLCSHDPDHAFQVADRVLLLDQGRVLAQGAVAQALTAENLSQLYGVAVRVVQIDARPRQRVCVPVLAA